MFRLFATILLLLALAGCAPAPPPAPHALPNPAISRGVLAVNGRPFEVRGINYIHTANADPAHCPDIHFGADANCPWDAGAVADDMAALAARGVNTVRVFLNYYVFGGARSVDPTYDMGVALEHLDTLIADANRHGIYVLPVLLAKYPQDRFGAEGAAAALELHVRPLVRHLAGRPGLLAWDLFNEPDLGGPVDQRCWDWDNAGYAGCFPLAAERLRFVKLVHDEVKALDPQRLTTVSLGFGKSYFSPKWASIRLADVVDFFSFHYYDNDPYDSGRYQAHWYYGQGFPADLRRAIVELHQLHLDKPVLISELGFPTGPGTLRPPSALRPDLLLALQTGRDNRVSGYLLWPFQTRYDELPGDLFVDPAPPQIAGVEARALAPPVLWLPGGLGRIW
jgi:hypothetical protein